MGRQVARSRLCGLWVARDTEVRKQSNEVWSIYAKKKEDWSEDLRTEKTKKRR